MAWAGCRSPQDNSVRRARIQAEEAARLRAEGAAGAGGSDTELERFELRGEVRRLPTELEALRARRADLVARLSDLLRTVEALEQDRAAAEQAKGSVEQKLAAERATLEAAEAALADLRAQQEDIDAARAEVESLLQRLSVESKRVAAWINSWTVDEPTSISQPDPGAGSADAVPGGSAPQAPGTGTAGEDLPAAENESQEQGSGGQQATDPK